MTWVGGRDPIWVSIKNQDNNFWFASTTAPHTSDRYIFVEGNNCAHFKYIPADSGDFIDWRQKSEPPKPDCTVDLLLCVNGKVIHGHRLTREWVDFNGDVVNPSHWALWPKGPKVVT